MSVKQTDHKKQRKDIIHTQHKKTCWLTNINPKGPRNKTILRLFSFAIIISVFFLTFDIVAN